LFWKKVEEIIIPYIENVVKKLIGSDYNITYMTKMTQLGEIDINCELDGITECSKKFISENKNSFDLIILQTCPFILMKYSIIYDLLKPSGILGITSYPRDINISENISGVNDNIISTKLFIHENILEGIVIYKKSSDGRRRSKKNYYRNKNVK